MVTEESLEIQKKEKNIQMSEISSKQIIILLMSFLNHLVVEAKIMTPSDMVFNVCRRTT